MESSPMAKETKRVLMTGAAGQIGSELAEALRKKYGRDKVLLTPPVPPPPTPPALVRILPPSPIPVFGPATPREMTPQDTVLSPTTIYGVTKVAGELLCDYYVRKYGLDVRGCRYPGLISPH